MTSKSMKPAPQAPKPLTEEEKVQQIARFLAQKREAFSTGILFNLCRVLDKDASSAHAKALVELSVEMADALIEKLYPVPNPSEKEGK